MQSTGPPSHAELDFNAPMSSGRAGRLIASLRPLAGAAVVDLGCGWGEFLLRLAAAEAPATAAGIDSNPVMIARARTNAAGRDRGELVRFAIADVATWVEPVDVAIAIGSSHAWGGTKAMLDAICSLLRPGGRLLLGEGIWERPPTAAALAGLGAEPGDFTDVAGLVDLCLASGFRLVELATATRDEWDNFESRYCASRERLLLDTRDAAAAAELRTEIDRHRDGWLHGYREILGFAYLTLAKPEQ